MLLMALLATLYLAYVLDPQKNLHGFPLALVNQDVGDNVDGTFVDFGNQVTDGLINGIPKDKVDLQVMGIGSARSRMQRGQVYGTIVIPGDFSKRLAILAASSVVAGNVERPIITVQTTPRGGPYATQITLQITEQALSEVNRTVGARLTEQVRARVNTELSGASRLTLATPINVVTAPYRPLPAGTGQGLSAFFYTLLLLLAGFTGAMIINTMTDSALGFMPTEYGPWYLHFPTEPISRLRTLLLKWGILVVTAAGVTGLFLAISAMLGMPIDHPVALYLYSAFAIIAVGVTALSVLAAFGSAGLLINLVLFIVLGLPSCGGTVPIEAVPKSISLLAHFEPMHQVFLGVRAILYFDSHGDAGLLRATWMTLFGLAVGLVFGIAITRFYDHKGLHRAPSACNGKHAIAD